MKIFTREWWSLLFGRIASWRSGDINQTPRSKKVIDQATESRLVSVDGVDVRSIEIWTESDRKDGVPSCKKHDYRKVRLRVTDGVARALTDGYTVTDYVCVNCTHGKRTIDKKLVGRVRA